MDENLYTTYDEGQMLGEHISKEWEMELSIENG